MKSESEVAQSCPTLSDFMDCSLPGSSAHGIFQARVLEWVAIAFFPNIFNFDKYEQIIYFPIVSITLFVFFFFFLAALDLSCGLQDP